MARHLRPPQRRHPRKKTNAKAATPVVNAVKDVAKDVKDVKDEMSNAAKGVMADVAAIAVVSVRANATSAQKAHWQKRVNPAPRAKVAATSVKVNAVKPWPVKPKTPNRWPWTLRTTL